ncbi:MAG: CRISPR-associated endonuclease Cas2 [Planctomycetes bacterium]|nr:CRISPR-associated endonuclease Cas2 [Planctomycetota bacterium]
MWLFTLFDLPVLTKEEKRTYVRFRKLLLQEGFTMLQFSVYAQYCTSEEASISKRRTIRLQLPADGQVRMVSVTDKQFANMEVFLGKTESEPEEPLGQGLLF